MLRYVFGLLSLTVLLATFTGCEKSDWGSTPNSEPAVIDGLWTEKNGELVRLDQMDETLWIHGTLTDTAYVGWRPFDPERNMRVFTIFPNFVAVKYDGPDGEMVLPLYVTYRGSRTSLIDHDISKSGSHQMFTIMSDRVKEQISNQPTFELTFFFDQEQNSDCWQGSLNNWYNSSTHLAWWPALPGEYFAEAKNEGGVWRVDLPNDYTYALVRRINSENILGTYHVIWYTENNRGTAARGDDVPTLTIKLNNDGTISAPSGTLSSEEVDIRLGG